MLVALYFPTAVLARYGDAEPLAVMLYAGVVCGAGLMLLTVVGLAQRQGLIEPPPDARKRREALAVAAWPTLVFAASIPLAAWHPLAAMLGWTAAALGPLARRFGVWFDAR